MVPLLTYFPLSAIHDFVSDISEWTMFLVIAFGCLIWTAKSSFKRHDVIIDYIKSIDGRIVDKQLSHNENNRDGVYNFYTVKYYDSHNRLHRLKLRVEYDTEVIILEDTLIR